MGVSGFDTSDFVVYTFKGLIIVRTEFDVSYFDCLIQQLNLLYKKFMLLRKVSSLTNQQKLHTHFCNTSVTGMKKY